MGSTKQGMVPLRSKRTNGMGICTAEEDEEVVQIGAQAYQEILKRKGKRK